MSVKCEKIIKLMENYAPPDLAESWDNIGLMVGSTNNDIKKILIALDINDNVIDEAVEIGANMIITHHPLIFKPIKNINSDTVLGNRLLRLIREDICVYSAHTNLDITNGGTNSTLAELLNLENITNLMDSEIDDSIGKIGELKESITFLEFANVVKKAIYANNITVSGDLNCKVKKVGICTGAGADREYMISAKEKGCDVYLTGDVGYHDAQFANDLGLPIIDGTHYLTEVLIVPVICEYLRKNVDIECVESKIDSQTLHII